MLSEHDDSQCCCGWSCNSLFSRASIAHKHTDAVADGQLLCYNKACCAAQLLHTFSNLDAFLSAARTRASSDRCFRPLVGVGVLVLVCCHAAGTHVIIKVADGKAAVSTMLVTSARQMGAARLVLSSTAAAAGCQVGTTACCMLLASRQGHSWPGKQMLITT
jgi:hypothetical protein